ncbi:MAG TPA: hypothetical protein VF686_06760, partial [Brevundimonas sp.]
IAALAILVAAGKGPAEASIPPSYRVLVVSSDREALALSEALVQYMSAAEAFFREPPAVAQSGVRACLQAPDFGACARPLIPRPEHWREAHHVIIRASQNGPTGLAWTCVGSGAHRPPTAEQTTVIDVQPALFGEDEEQSSQLRVAMNCIQSAAAESVAP